MVHTEPVPAGGSVRRMPESHFDEWTAQRYATFSSPHRYAWPAELDLMARLAGMTLRERWADWHRAPFTGESRAHISV